MTQDLPDHRPPASQPDNLVPGAAASARRVGPAAAPAPQDRPITAAASDAWAQAVAALAMMRGTVTIAGLQRRLRLPYSRALALMEALQQAGLASRQKPWRGLVKRWTDGTQPSLWVAAPEHIDALQTAVDEGDEATLRRYGRPLDIPAPAAPGQRDAAIRTHMRYPARAVCQAVFRLPFEIRLGSRQAGAAAALAETSAPRSRKRRAANPAGAVLGIDAAWTTRNASAVALAACSDDGSWRLIKVAPSYAAFVGRPDYRAGQTIEPIDAAALLSCAAALAGCSVGLVAVDMPLGHREITGRRRCDNLISSRYGSMGCSTHSPGIERPGAVGRTLYETLGRAGYPLQTAEAEAMPEAATRVTGPATIEVYPHPALLSLSGKSCRLPYKVGKRGKYWPGLSPARRTEMLLDQWACIVRMLETRIAGVEAALPPLPPGCTVRQLKNREDEIDAIICAWVGICALEGRAHAYGDEDAAIWVPTATA